MLGVSSFRDAWQGPSCHALLAVAEWCHFRSLPPSADLAAPEPLSAADAKDAGPLIDLAGEYLARCLHSRTWQLREAALTALARDLAAGRVQGVAAGSAGAPRRAAVGRMDTLRNQL